MRDEDDVERSSPNEPNEFPEYMRETVFLKTVYYVYPVIRMNVDVRSHVVVKSTDSLTRIRDYRR